MTGSHAMSGSHAMTPTEAGATATEEPTIGRLVADATRDFSSLVRSEVELAKSELKVSVKAGGISIALFAVAGFLLLLGLVMLSFAFAYFLDWLFAGTATAFLIVFAVYVLVAGVLGLVGARKIKQVKAPEQTIESVKETKQVLARST